MPTEPDTSTEAIERLLHQMHVGPDYDWSEETRELIEALQAKLAEAERSAWNLPPEAMPPLHAQVLIELREGVGQVCDVGCYIGKIAVEGGGSEDRWILADVRLDTRQIKRWALIHPCPPKEEVEALQQQNAALVEALKECAKRKRLRRCAEVGGNTPDAVNGLMAQFDEALAKAGDA